MRGKIDTHQHVVPPAYRSWLVDQGIDAGGLALPTWEADAATEMMDKLSIRAGILSVSTPGVHLRGDHRAPDDEARSWARKVNEFAAGVVEDAPDRFGFFATLTLPDVDGALAEAAYALDILHADGVVLLSSVYGRYLGDPEFAPLFDELNRRSAVVFVHPSELLAQPVTGVPAFAIDFLLDTTRTALHMAMSGTLARCPDLKVILSHGGGFLPYAAQRMSPFAGLGDPTAGLELLRRFYFDLALSSSPFALPSLLAFADPTHITYGSDFPYAPPAAYESMMSSLEKFPLTDDLRAAIDHRNAETLFPRFCA